MVSGDFKELFTRHKDNPVIIARDLEYPANSVFNCAATSFGDETLLLLRVEDRRGISHLTTAISRDGVSNWRIDSKPTLMPSPSTHPEEIWGIEDPRIVRIDDLDAWAILYTAYSRSGPLVAMATTKDFKSFQRRGMLMPPDDKDAALFPVKFGGRWALIHRPLVTGGSGAHMWISFSPDFVHWGDRKVVLPARHGGWWDANKVGLSTPPLKTDEGWLILYHGVKNTAGGCIYRLGLALLDLDDPTRLIARGDEWVFGPEEDYEITGDVDKVVFPCGWVANGDNLRIYYGGADKCIALATAKISEIMKWLKKPAHRLDTVKKESENSKQTRPWGLFEDLSAVSDHKVKRITVLPGQRLSYQRHHKRSEHWYVVEGTALVTLEGEDIQLDAGMAMDIPVKSWHRVKNQGQNNLVLIETQTGSYFGEDDIERSEDDYGRDSTT